MHIFKKMLFLIACFLETNLIAITMSEWKTMLLQDTERALDNARKIKVEWMCNEYSRESYVACSYQCPFFMFDECFTKTCLLNRQFGLRRLLEVMVANKLIKAIDDASGETVHYVSFASGALFLDLVILAKVFSERPQANIFFSAIDIVYNPAICGVQGELGPALFKSCITSMFPEASFDMRCIDNTDLTVEQILERIVNPSVLVSIDIGGEITTIDGEITALCCKSRQCYECLSRLIKKQYPTCMSVYARSNCANYVTVDFCDSLKYRTDLYQVDTNSCKLVES